MNAREALGRLTKLGVPAVTTGNAAAVLGISDQAASHTLRRLAGAGLMTPVRKGIWALGEVRDPLVLADYVTAPYPAYLSLQTALYRHGMIGQIPEMTFLVSLARSARTATPLGTYSVHHVQPHSLADSSFSRNPGSSSPRLKRPSSTFSIYPLRAGACLLRSLSWSCHAASEAQKRGAGSRASLRPA